MGHGRHFAMTSYEKAPVAVADYNVTGELTPDATCNYFVAGMYNGHPYSRREDGAFFIWSTEVLGLWYIADELGNTINCWERWDVNIIGVYNPSGTTVGIATVAAGPH